MQNHNNDKIKTSDRVLLEKYTSHFLWKSSKGLLKGFNVWEGVGDWTELQHIDPHSYGHNSVSFPFSWAAQPGDLGAQPLWDMVFIPASSLRLIWSPTDLTFCLYPGYIIVRHPPSSCNVTNRTQFNPSTVKVISWYSSTGCISYLHRCISDFDSLDGVDMLQ